MSGHSKWSSIKHKKGRLDAIRGKLFTKLIKEITVAAKEGGGDQDANSRLRTAVSKAKEGNMPNDTITKAIKRGTGELAGVSYEEIIYEGYGPNGVAVYVEVLTDNKNRSAAEIRSIFSKSGGALGAGGCVAWMFDLKGQILIKTGKIEEEVLMNIVLDAGAEDIITDDDYYDISTAPENFSAVKEALDKVNCEYETAEITRLPQNTVNVSGSDAQKIIRLLEKLEDDDDVQNVYSNFNTEDDID